MATNTYVALDTKTVGTAVPTVTFTNIPLGYTDLVLVAQPAISSGNDNMRIRVGNGSVDSGSNYSWTALTGNGTRALSDRASNQTSILSDYDAYMQTTLGNNTKVIHFQNYSNTTTFKTILSRSSNAPVGTDALVNTWRSTAAINTITLFLNGGIQNFAVGSTFTIYGIAAIGGDTTPKATGGVVTSDATYYYHTFLGSNTFTPNQTLSCDYLIVAGGGGAGNNGSGGGGAGGYRTATASTFTAGAYSILVGAGGAGRVSSGQGNGASGSLSAIGSTESAGGGFSSYPSGTSSSGGSGGGSGSTSAGGAGNTPSTSPSQGNNGGNNGGVSGGGAGGGGGAGAAGGNGSGSTSGIGGIGSFTAISGGATTGYGQLVSGNYYFAGGGGGGGNNDFGVKPGAAGGSGGGGAGGASNVAGTNALAFTGGGGGGAGNVNPNWVAGGNGGSGIVIIRYAK